MKAIETDKKLGKIYSDPNKAEIAQKINIDKIITEFLKTDESSDVNINDKSSTNNTQGDELSSILTKIEEYAQTGIPDEMLSNYMYGDSNQENSELQNNSTETLSSNFDKTTAQPNAMNISENENSTNLFKKK